MEGEHSTSLATIAESKTASIESQHQTQSTNYTGANLTAQKQPHIRQYDVIRGVACLMIFIYHCNMVQLAWWRDWRYYGYYNDSLGWCFLPIEEYGFVGVTLFFVLSGLCLHHGTLQKGSPFNIVNFIGRRIARLYPAYIVVVIVGLIIQRIKKPNANDLDFQLFTHATLIHGVYSNTFSALAGQLWSIGVEWQFYVVYALLFWIIAKWGAAPLYISFLAVNIFVFFMGWAPPGNPIYPGISFSLLTFNTWLLGVCLAESWNKGVRLFQKPALVLGIGGILLFASEQYSGLVAQSFLFGSGCFAVIMEMYIFNKLPFGFLQKILEKFGIISYSVYLWHAFVLDFYIWLLFTKLNIQSCTLTRYSILLPLSLTTTILISIVSYRICEVAMTKSLRQFLTGKH